MSSNSNAPELHLVPPAPAMQDPLIGRTLDGRYTIEGVLGAGGMGLVYRARHAVLGKPLAIKVLKPSVSSDEQVMARFRREAQSASAIGSPHICDVSDFGTIPDGSTYFVMELLDGPSLTARMARERPLPVALTVHVAQQLCDALQAAHERGIIHRDLKPDNVHLVRQGSRENFVKVLDFGIAKVGGAADKKLTQAGQVFGTPHYMSPEQCAGREVDHRTDLYALGVMLYEMATGKVPFDADNLMGVLTKHVYEQPIPPRELPAPVDVPAGLEAVILKCLAKQREHRYPSMAELRADLDRVAQGVTPSAVMEALDASTMVAAPGSNYPPASGSNYPPAIAAGVAAVEIEAPRRRTGLLVFAALGLLLVGAGVFATAFFFAFEAREPVAAAEPPPLPEPAPEPTPPIAADPRPSVEADPVPAPEPVVEPAPTPAAPVMVRLTTDPAGAEIYSRDGALIGNAPLDLPRPAEGATSELTIRMPGYADRTFTLSTVTAPEVTLGLERARSSSGPRRVTPVQPIAPMTPRPLGPGPVTSRPRRADSEIIDPF